MITSEFETKIRNSETPHPTHRKFTLKKWEKCFETIANANERDTSLFECGKWVFSRLERIRQEVSKISLPLPKEKLVRMHVGFLNRTQNVVKVQTRIKKTPENNVVLGEQIIQSKLTGNILGIDATPDDILATSIDGAEFPLGQALRSIEKKMRNVSIDPLEVISNEQKIMLLGQYYFSLEETWRNMLWNGYFIQTKENMMLIRPQGNIYDQASAVSNYRRLALITQGVSSCIHFWNKNLSHSEKAALSVQPVIKIEGSGKKRKVFLTHDHTVKTIPPSHFIARMLAEEEYLQSLLQIDLPNLPGVNINLIINSWEVLTAYVKCLFNKFPEDNSIYAIGTFYNYAPSIVRRDLVDIFVKSCGMDLLKADSIITFLTFDPDNGGDLWASPLIQLEDKLLPVVSPILSCNLLRSIELWLKRGGVDLSQRGTLFEDEVRKAIGDSIKSSSVLKDCGCHFKELKIGDNKEEIDILLFVGKKILVGEIKCSLYPTDPIEYFHIFQTFKYASEQAVRKAKKVFECFTEVKSKFHQLKDLDKQEIELIPFIITNTTLGVGYSINNVPVVDLFILNKFLEGTWDRMVMFDNKGNRQVGETVTFYTTEDEASSYIKEYLGSPPQLNMYKNHIKSVYFPHICFDENDFKTVTASLTVELPLPELFPKDVPE